MPTKKKSPSPKRKPARASSKPSSSGGVSAMASAQLQQLRKTVDQLRTRLQKETSARAAASTMIAEAKKARATLTAQIESLRKEGSRLASELAHALGDSDKREAARRQAVEKMSELRAELAHRTEELRRKSEELARLAVNSAGRARDIIMSEGGSNPATEPPTKETDSVDVETVEREESPRESSIEREIHPERKS